LDDILQEIANRNGRGVFYMPRNRFVGDNAKYLKHKVFVSTREYYHEVPCPNGCGEDASVFRRGDRYVVLCNHRAATEECEIAAEEVELFVFDQVAFEELLKISRNLYKEYCSLVEEKPRPQSAYPLGSWAAKYVESYDRGRGFVVLKRGNQRRFEIPPKSNRVWDILEELFTTDNPEGLVKLPTNWSSNFNRKIGSTSMVNKDSDVVKIAKCIHPHTAGKGRGSDGLYYFMPTRT